MALKRILNLVIAGGIYLILVYGADLMDTISRRHYNHTMVFLEVIQMLAPMSITVFAIALKEKNNIGILTDEPTNNEHI